MTTNKNQKHSAVIYAVGNAETAESKAAHTAQLEALRAYASEKDLDVQHEFTYNGNGGAKTKRETFEELLAFLKKQLKGNMPVLLCANFDNITRNFKGAVAIDKLRLQNGLHVHCVQDNIILSPDSMGDMVFQWEVKVLMAKQYLHRISEDAKHRYAARQSKKMCA